MPLIPVRPLRITKVTSNGISFNGGESDIFSISYISTYASIAQLMVFECVCFEVLECWWCRNTYSISFRNNHVTQELFPLTENYATTYTRKTVVWPGVEAIEA